MSSIVIDLKRIKADNADQGNGFNVRDTPKILENLILIAEIVELGSGWTLGGTSTLTGAVTMVQAGYSTTFTGTGKVSFSSSATLAGLNTGIVAVTDPSSLANGDLWYNTDKRGFKFRIDGYTSTLIADQWENTGFGLSIFNALTPSAGVGDHNTVFGSGAGLLLTTGRFNTIFGPSSSLTSGSYNMFFGYISQFTTGQQNIWIGYDIGPADVTQNRTLSIANLLTGKNIQASTFLSTDPGYNDNPSAGSLGIRIKPHLVGIVNGTDNSSITPLHINSAGNVMFIVMDAGQSPFLLWNSRGAASNVKMWGAWTNTGGDWKLSTVTDDGGTTSDKIVVTRAGQFQLPNAGQGIAIKEGSDGRMGQTTLVTGTKVITITGLTVSSRAFVQLVAASGGASTITYQAVCTADTLTIRANVAAGTINVADGSLVNYWVFEQAP